MFFVLVGVIPHSARPPSSNFSGARLSFAVKLSRNERVARTKEIHEELQQVTAVRSLMASVQHEGDTDEGGASTTIYNYSM